LAWGLTFTGKLWTDIAKTVSSLLFNAFIQTAHLR
jgi:hypothetical protein